MNHDLFPKTLLVDSADGHVFTTSLKAAEHFQKRHKNVLQSIEKLLTDCPDKEFAGLNLQPSTIDDKTDWLSALLAAQQFVARELNQIEE
jgi:phage regulator Rha-like protein